MNTLAYKFDQTQALVTKARPFLIWKRVDERSSPSAPQVRSGKTVITQRKAESTDLTKGQVHRSYLRRSRQRVHSAQCRTKARREANGKAG